MSVRFRRRATVVLMLLVGVLLAAPAGAAGGDLVWADRLGGTSFDSAYGVAVDGSGNVYVTGSFQGTVDFDPGSGVSPLTPAGVNDGFVVKLDAAGGLVWAVHLGGTSFDSGQGVAVDGSGNVYVIGSFYGTADFDPDPVVTFNLVSAGESDVFVVKLDAAGGLVWADQLGGISGDASSGVAVDASGNVYATGYFQGTADFDPGAGFSGLTSAGFFDGFVVKLDAAGGLVWADQLGGTSGEWSAGVAVDGSGNVYATGS
ncbi:MAG TPA: SBBP repeat-containing protein, partial [Acidimicrobiia bacterium]|nr:SBBP repeat-containing protein [Acidimicrobiia bacterium]